MRARTTLLAAQRNEGFTLIELLVVIAIIAILAGILFPVFSQVREKARQSQCMSNLRNQALAFMQYMNDYDEKVTPFENWGGLTGCLAISYAGGDVVTTVPGSISEACDPFQRWSHRIYPYLKNIQIFSDPSGGTSYIYPGPYGGCKQAFADAVGGTVYGAWCWSFHPMFAGILFSYGYNQLLALHCSNAGSIAKLERAADVVLVSDCSHKDIVPTSRLIFSNIGGSELPPEYITSRIVWANTCVAFCVPTLQTEAYTRHHLGSILTFADGHTKFIQHRNILGRGYGLVGLDQLPRFRLQ